MSGPSVIASEASFYVSIMPAMKAKALTIGLSESFVNESSAEILSIVSKSFPLLPLPVIHHHAEMILWSALFTDDHFPAIERFPIYYEFVALLDHLGSVKNEMNGLKGAFTAETIVLGYIRKYWKEEQMASAQLRKEVEDLRAENDELKRQLQQANGDNMVVSEAKIEEEEVEAVECGRLKRSWSTSPEADTSPKKRPYIRCRSDFVGPYHQKLTAALRRDLKRERSRERSLERRKLL